MLAKSTFTFLRNLNRNNNRDWFNANKHKYQEAHADFVGFIAELIGRIAVFDPPVAQLDPKKSVFRIYRDTRFSKDKTPYKTNFGAHLVSSRERPHDRAGYYIHVEPGNSFLAGGAYLPPGPWLNAIRASIDKDGAEFVAILKRVSFKKYFGELEGEKLKTVPRGYTVDHPHIELLRFKSFLASHQVGDEQLMAKDAAQYATRVFKTLKPFDDFLNKSL